MMELKNLIAECTAMTTIYSMEYDVNDGVNGDVNDKVNDSRNDKVNDSVNATYLVIKGNPGIQRKGIAKLTGKSIPTIDRHLAILVKEDMIEHRDSDKTGGYYAKNGLSY